MRAFARRSAPSSSSLLLAGDAGAAPNPTAPSTAPVRRPRRRVHARFGPSRSSSEATGSSRRWSLPGASRFRGRCKDCSGRAASARPRGPANSGNYVFSFDGQVGESVAFVAPDGVSTFVGKGRGERGGDTEKVKMLRPGVANDWKLTAAAHIVELEVSRRKGRGPLPPASTSSLTASKVRVLDRRAFAGSIADVISWAARDFDAVVREKGQAPLLDGMHRLNVHPTWSRDRKQLAIRFVLRAMGPEAQPAAVRALHPRPRMRLRLQGRGSGRRVRLRREGAPDAADLLSPASAGPHGPRRPDPVTATCRRTWSPSSRRAKRRTSRPSPPRQSPPRCSRSTR